jgi:NAD(P)-dependent dehydrogenase (short-subunit alcohol dehydrogenase family)
MVAGADPDRVVFLGERGELSLGVRTHELSLPAFFARRRSRRTSRGLRWSIAALPTSRIQDAPAVVERMAARLQGVDTVVVLAGITDALRVTSPAAWDRNLRATLDALMRALPRGAQVIVGEIPPLGNAGSLSRPARVAAGLQGRVLNTRTRLVVSDYPAVVVAGFPEELTMSVWRPESEEHRYRDTYKVWGEDLVRYL